MSRAGEAITGSVRRVVIGTFLAVALIAAPANAASAQRVVPTDKGPVRGVATDTVRKFLGIPYAAPPVGDLRWRAPQAPARWRGPRDATEFANHCPQHPSPFGFESSTEDCLYLNVFTPNGKVSQEKNGKTKAKKPKDLPVMVWLHGGALVVGESDDYDPTRLVEQGVVVVTVNYRLGYLGFLAHPALSEESGNGSGNYGLMDQQAALRWVQSNIAKFGGNTDNVTIFGQSAGGLSVHSHLASPTSAGLFDRAIAQSGAYATTNLSLEDAESSGMVTATNLGCQDQTLECLRSLSVETILARQPDSPAEGTLLPNIDGNVLTKSIEDAFESGEFNRVPVIEGSTHDEFTIFQALYVDPLIRNFPPSFYPLIAGILAGTLGVPASGSEIAARYPLSDYPNMSLALAAIGTDAVFACPGRRVASALSQHVPTWAYELDDPDVPQIFIPPAAYPFGSYHAADVLYLFDSPLRGGHAPFDAESERLADAIVKYWTQFGRAGSPNRQDLPHWPQYTAASDIYMSLRPPTPQPTTGFAEEHKCAFWDAQ